MKDKKQDCHYNIGSLVFYGCMKFYGFGAGLPLGVME